MGVTSEPGLNKEMSCIGSYPEITEGVTSIWYKTEGTARQNVDPQMTTVTAAVCFLNFNF